MASTQRQTNVEIVRDTYEAFDGGDIETAMAPMAEDVEWTEPAGSAYGGTYHGPTEVLENVFDPCMQEFDPFSVDPERFVDGGNTVVAIGAFHATTRENERIESPFAHVWELEDGEVVRFTNYTDTALWL